MKNKLKFAMLLFLFFFNAYNCSRSIDPLEDGYAELKCIELFNKPVEAIAQTVAKVLNVYPVSLIDTIYHPSPSNDLEYRYITSDSVKFSVRTDSMGIPQYITYNYIYYGNSKEFTYEKNEADSLFLSIIKKLGILPSEKDYFSSSKKYPYYFQINFGQKYQNINLWPQMEAGIAGDTKKINYIIIYNWYLNLDDIKQLISNEELKNIAYNYWISSGDSLEFDDIEVDDFMIENNKLCRRFFFVKGHQRPSLLSNTCIDIQSGEVVFSYLSRSGPR